jgi:DNA processing protein
MLRYEIALTFLPGIGDITGKKLVAYCGGAEAVFKLSRRDLLRIKALGENLVQRLLEGRDEALKRAGKEVSFVKKYGIKTLFFLDKEYPYRLTHCADSPILLYYKGNADLNARRILAVVGTRRATEYGRDICTRIIQELREMEVLVISGLAFGIDSVAHKEAVNLKMPTVGVLGHGLDRLYPPQNRSLAEKMVRNGGLLTDFPTETNPDRENFPKRNRIIAGLCDALVVVEAAEKGGALITADIANSYDRDVFAVPGRINDEFSKGCNQFIKNNRAALIESAEDIRNMMGWDSNKNSGQGKQTSLFVTFTEQEKEILKLIQIHRDPGIDLLTQESGLSGSNLAKALLELEFKGAIRCLPGKRYQLG